VSLPPEAGPESSIRRWIFKARFFRDTPDRPTSGENALVEAKKRIDAALGTAPREATLWALLGEWDLLMVQYGGFPGGMAYGRKAENANDRALSLDPKNPEAHLSKGIELYFKPWFVGGSVAGALKEFQRANTLRPHDARILSWIGIAENRLHHPGALSYEQEAVGVCPDSALYISREKTFNPRAPHP